MIIVTALFSLLVIVLFVGSLLFIFDKGYNPEKEDTECTQREK